MYFALQHYNIIINWWHVGVVVNRKMIDFGTLWNNKKKLIVFRLFGDPISVGTRGEHRAGKNNVSAGRNHRLVRCRKFPILNYYCVFDLLIFAFGFRHVRVYLSTVIYTPPWKLQFISAIPLIVRLYITAVENDDVNILTV